MHASTITSTIAGRRPHKAGRGFSLTELLVVIGIIVLLVGLLLVALATVRKKALRSQTESLLNQILNSCTSFQAEHGIYPGVIPDDVLLAHANANGGQVPISSTENMLLHLVGGYRVLPPNTAANSLMKKEFDDYRNPDGSNCPVLNIGAPPNVWQLKVSVLRLNEGPYIDGKPYAPYFTVGADDLKTMTASATANSGQIGEASAGFLPDLVDAWGQPILYLRQVRNRGPLVVDTTSTTSPQFLLCGVTCFLHSTGIGEKNINEADLSIFGNPGAGSPVQQNQMFSAILGHQSFYKSATTNPAGNPLNGTARGAIVLVSAGPDGVYFAKVDGPGSNTDPITSGNIDAKIINIGPKVIDEFDDIRVYGGG